MVNDHGFAGAVSNVTSDLQHGAAQRSLRRHAGLENADEGTPLLRNGDTAGAGNPTEWEGHADFEGLPWYRKPSVSYTSHFVEID